MTISNLAFLFPFYIAMRLKHIYFATSAIISMLISIFYHLCSGEIACFIIQDALLWRVSDHIAAQHMVVATLLLAQTLESGQGYASMMRTVAPFILIVFILQWRFQPQTAMAIMSAVFVFTAFHYLVYRRGSQQNPHRFVWPLLLIGAAIIIFGLVLFYVLDHGEASWFWHSLWHIDMSIGESFILLGLSRDVNDTWDETFSAVCCCFYSCREGMSGSWPAKESATPTPKHSHKFVSTTYKRLSKSPITIDVSV